MKEVHCKICGEVGLLDEDLPERAPGDHFMGSIMAGVVCNNKKSDLTQLKTLLGIWNHREQKANWICLSCLCEKFGIEENRKVRGGMF